jgi:hypothetical protein
VSGTERTDVLLNGISPFSSAVTVACCATEAGANSQETVLESRSWLTSLNPHSAVTGEHDGLVDRC